MKKNISLTEGNILEALVKLALPLMGTSFIQMAYNLTDLMWLGRLSTDATAAAGAAGNLMWLGSGLILMSQIGVGVHVAQSYGKKDVDKARKFASNGLRFDILIGLLYGIILFIFREQLIGFFNFDKIKVHNMSVIYLSIIAIGMPFNFMNPVFSNILNSTGNSMTPFKVNGIGLLCNMILDPILIFGLGPINGLGIKGAALATIIAQIVVSLIFIFIVGSNKNVLYSNMKIFEKMDIGLIKKIIKTGYPACLQTVVMASISMLLARIVAAYGAVGVAVQTIGSQIESLSWMTSEGFAQAISTFTGQNYGAKKYDRINEGYNIGMRIVGGIGILATILLVFFAEPVFSIFTPGDAIAIAEGVNYLVILGFSQFFMSLEIGTAGLFNGLGKTSIPAIVGIVFNALRIPMSLFSTRVLDLGLNGVWWSVSITGILKGIVMIAIYKMVFRERLLKGDI